MNMIFTQQENKADKLEIKSHLKKRISCKTNEGIVTMFTDNQLWISNQNLEVTSQ